MEEQTLNIQDYLNAFKRRRISILVIASLIFIIGAVTAAVWPATYRSSATILIKEQDIPPDLVRSTVTSFASQRIHAISQKVMARPNLLEIIKKYGLYAENQNRLTTEEIIEEMRENIDLDLIDAEVVDPRTGRPTAATIAFQLSFSGHSPGQVQQVANELMSLYLKENLKERSDQARETSAFLSKEAERLSEEIGDLESKLAKFKEAHVNSLPELKQLNLSMIERAEREISGIETQINAKEQTRIYLVSQLAQVKPYGADISLDPKTRLQALRTEYLALVARYSGDHPDVIRISREIEGLEQETGQVDSSADQLKRLDAMRAELAALRKKYSAEHPDVVKLERQITSLESMPAPRRTTTSKLSASAADNPDNPAYIQIQTQLEATDSEIRALRAKQASQKKKLDEYEQRLIETPQVEREYSGLNRNLKNAVAKYQEIRAKQLSAEISQELEKDSKGERFEIVEPPIRPEEPVSPNRKAILFLSLFLALGTGLGFAVIRENLDDAVRGSKTIASAVGVAPLAIIPYMENDSEARQRSRRSLVRASAAAVAVIVLLAATHIFWKPLDVLWYKALRKADVVINT